jgi:hypothetical protein
VSGVIVMSWRKVITAVTSVAIVFQRTGESVGQTGRRADGQNHGEREPEGAGEHRVARRLTFGSGVRRQFIFTRETGVIESYYLLYDFRVAIIRCLQIQKMANKGTP